MPDYVDCAGDGETRLDILLCAQSGLTRSRVAQLIREGQVLVSGQPAAKAGLKPQPGEIVRLIVPPVKESAAQAQDIPLHIFYEDEDLAVVEKPAGMVVHPAAGNPEGTLVNALLHHLNHLSGIGGEMRPGIVHRLDKDTSGLLLVAKNDSAHLALSRQLQERQMEKHYRAVVEGHLKEPQGLIDAPIARSQRDRKRMAIDPAGRPSQTQWQVLEELRGATLLDVRLITGRTHQIRVHMASIHHPVAGDPIYGLKKGTAASRLLLHAYTLSFTHPVTGERLTFTAPLPPAFEKNLNALRR